MAWWAMSTRAYREVPNALQLGHGLGEQGLRAAGLGVAAQVEFESKT